MNSDTHINLSLQTLRQFRLIYGSAKRQFKDIEKTCGISGSKLWLLLEISKYPGIGISELAERVSIHLSTCSLLVDKLKTKKMVIKIRSGLDQRRVGLKITTEGIKVLSNAPGPAEGILPLALQELSEADLKKLHASLGKLIKNLHMLDENSAKMSMADM